jgi:hypothetical protein
VPITCLSLAAASIKAEFPSGKLPTTFVLRLISFIIRSSGLLVFILVQCSLGKNIYSSVSWIFSDTILVKVLHNHGHVKLENYFLDGTKIESKLVVTPLYGGEPWINFEKRIDEKLLEYLNEAEKIAEEENLEYGDLDLEEMGRKKITKDEIQQISNRLSNILKLLNQKVPEKKEKQESKKKFKR